jgi:hypothetical protein
VERKLKKELDSETNSLKVRNKEINIERQKRKEDYQNSLYR